MLRACVLLRDAARARRQDAVPELYAAVCFNKFNAACPAVDALRSEAKTHLVDLSNAAGLALLASLAQSAPARLDCLLCGRGPIIQARGERPSALTAPQTAQDGGLTSGAPATEDKGAAARRRHVGGSCPHEVCRALAPGPEDSLGDRCSLGERRKKANAGTAKDEGARCLTNIRAPLQTRSRAGGQVLRGRGTIFTHFVCEEGYGRLSREEGDQIAPNKSRRAFFCF